MARALIFAAMLPLAIVISGCNPYRSEVVNHMGRAVEYRVHVTGPSRIEEGSLNGDGNALLFPKPEEITAIDYWGHGQSACHLDALAVRARGKLNRYGRFEVPLIPCFPANP
jgi:hypothetical protein